MLQRLAVLAAACLLLLLNQPRVASATVTQEPIGVTGFNADTIVDAAASTTTGNHTANATFNYTADGGSGSVYTSSTNANTVDITTPGPVHNSGVWFQNGWNSQTTGLPYSGSFASAYTNVTGAHTTFDFGYNGTTIDYADNNTLYFYGSSTSGGTPTPSSATLILATSAQFTTLDFLATGELPNAYTTPTQFDVRLNFSDSSTDTYLTSITTGPVGDTAATPTVPTGSNLALSGLNGTANGNSNHTNNEISSGRFFENDISLSAADQAKTLTSITFIPDSLEGSTEGIYAVSGTVISTPEPTSVCILMLAALPLLRRRRKATQNCSLILR